MKPQNKNSEDLDYLAELGFEKIPLDAKDVRALRNKIRARSFSYTNGFKISAISFVLGGLMGIGLFFMFNQNAPSSVVDQTKTIVAPTTKDPLTPVVLDTVTLVHENFEKPASDHFTRIEQNLVTESHNNDSLEIVQLKRPFVSFSPQPIEQEKIKFIVNSTIVYLHDLKVSDYRNLYFKKNQFVKFTGLSAEYTERQNASYTGSHLKQSADYFLHEEVAQALLFFKQGKYDQCINSLDLVSEFNKNDVNCSFYLGMCYYYKKNYKKALDNFEECIASLNNAFYQEALFYRSLSYLESGKREEALVLLKQIVEEGGFYAEKAREYLK